MEMQHSCVQCSKKYSNISNLRKHVIKFHPDNDDYLASLQLRKNKHYNFACDQCNKRFTHLRNLRFHVRTHGGIKDTSAPDITDTITSTTMYVNQCAMCSNFCADRKTIIEHYRKFHNIPIEQKKMSFQSEEEFITWKLTFENDTNCKYVLNFQKCFKSHVSTGFICHRSGRYIPEGKNIRHLKILGSKKINALCPASIKIKKLNNGTCEVTIIDTHVGHQNDIGHLNLSKTERENLAVKIASKVPFEDILDEIRDSITDSELKRLHLLTKKDLYNIETCFNLRPSSVRHKDDVISVESKNIDKAVSESSNLIIVEEELHTLEAKAHLKELSTSTKLKTTSFESKKRWVASLLEELQHIVSSSTPAENEELDAIGKALVPIKHTLRALKNSKGIHPKAKNKEPPNKNIRKQRFSQHEKSVVPQKLETASNETTLNLISL